MIQIPTLYDDACGILITIYGSMSVSLCIRVCVCVSFFFFNSNPAVKSGVMVKFISVRVSWVRVCVALAGVCTTVSVC